MKYIFNSLGSNYTFSFIWHSLLYYFVAPPKNLVMDQLDAQLRRRFPDFEVGPFYFYKGRDALEFVLQAFSTLENQPVLTQAFTCHALEASIRRAGGLPAYVDVDAKTLNPTVETIEKAYKKNPDAKVLIIQHTLGIPAEIEKIRKWCDTNKIFLIEDLAQAVGGVDTKNSLLGTHADAVIFSFGRDKIIDTVSGGVCIIRKKPVGFSNENYRTLTSKSFKRDHLYPVLTYCIRFLYPIYIGRVIAYLSRIFGVIQSPIKARFDYITALPSSLAALAVRQFECLDLQLAHRREISKIYFSQLEKLCPIERQVLERGSNLRFPIIVKNPDAFLKFLQSKNIFIHDRWYRAPVDSGALQYFSKYKDGSCPQAEEFAKTIVNLPTHIHISRTDAALICEEVTMYLEAKE